MQNYRIWAQIYEVYLNSDRYNDVLFLWQSIEYIDPVPKKPVVSDTNSGSRYIVEN